MPDWGWTSATQAATGVVPHDTVAPWQQGLLWVSLVLCYIPSVYNTSWHTACPPYIFTERVNRGEEAEPARSPPTLFQVPPEKRQTRKWYKLSPSKVGTGSSIFRPALAGGAAQESTKANQIKIRKRQTWGWCDLDQSQSWWKALMVGCGFR